eukprot:GEZU01029633.1.p1 GENE.GEZU01029633.1~~GEZU01029633.1.p1  ORF type:complete len:611 (+),score=184.53 GEZU01029633.1:1-1833(+)
MQKQVIVVGGGLSGLSAAHTVLERGGNVVVIDKNPFFGGNSTKATSGINGALTRTQIKLGIQDSPEKFYEDTARSARDLLRPELARVLTYNSASAVEWLQDKFKLDLSLVSRLGGHSYPRTHRGNEKFPGMTITYALMEMLEEISKKEPNRARCLFQCRVTRLLYDNGTVIGVEYQDKDGKKGQEYGPVILATGGYAADFTETSLLKKYRPDIYELPTTNGDYSTGDGIKMATAIGANAVDLEKVQVHPTGLVDPKEPNAKVKFLAAEALRGVGGILLDREGQRFADELGHRDYVTGRMWDHNKPPYRLVLNSAAAKEIEWHCKHYSGRGLMKFFKTGHELAAEMGIPASQLSETFKKYNEVARTKTCPFGKKYFDNVPFDINDSFYVSIVTPVLHFCMGGIEINPEGEVLNSSKQQIRGLFAAGEVCGGVHGANRLGGSSLLGCVVFGRVAGNTASRYLFNNLLQSQGTQPMTASRRVASLESQLHPSSNPNDLQVTIAQSAVQTQVNIQPNQNRISLDIFWNQDQQQQQQQENGAIEAAATTAPLLCGSSAIVAPTGEDLVRCSREGQMEMLVAKIEPNDPKYVRSRERNPYFADFRPELYADLWRNL